MSTSLLLHFLLLVVLALCAVSIRNSGAIKLISTPATPSDDSEYALLEDLPELTPSFVVVEDEHLEFTPLVDTPTSHDMDVPPFPESIELSVGSHRGFDIPSAADLDREMSKRDQDDGRSERDVLRNADTVEQAVDRIAGELRAKLAQGDLLTVWLLDASVSLADDRQRVAARLAELLPKLAQQAHQHSRAFISAAVAFGSGTQELVGMTRLHGRIIEAVKEVPIDDSGIENVFSAVAQVVKRYGGRWKGSFMIVVWTDESGDDIHGLEPTIELCRSRGVSVSVVGPSAMFGRQLGSHTWVHRPTQRMYCLPINRGPDTALPERLRLAYWFTDYPVRSSARDELVGKGDRWFIHNRIETLASGFGPYAMVRLTRETGGTYTLLDHPQNRGPFQLERLQSYLPDYRSWKEIRDDLAHHPLRRAVVSAVNVTLRDDLRKQPRMDFFGQRYHNPGRFRNLLRMELPLQLSKINTTATLIEKALEQFGSEGMEDHYDNETSARWRAWYDLTRGRLLAQSVRHQEYRLVCGVMGASSFLRPQTNWVVLQPSTMLRSSVVGHARATEAKRLLERCVRRNPETPWAILAQHELHYPLGIDVRQDYIPPPPPRSVLLGPAAFGACAATGGTCGTGSSFTPPNL